MGNCEGIDSNDLLIQHPNGEIDKMYSSITAGEVIKMKPGHYVSLVITLPASDNQADDESNDKTIKLQELTFSGETRTLYSAKLIGGYEKILKTKRHANMKKSQQESKPENQGSSSQVSIHGRIVTQRLGSSSSSSNLSSLRSKSWQPSLQSIAEADRGCFGELNSICV